MAVSRSPDTCSSRLPREISMRSRPSYAALTAVQSPMPCYAHRHHCLRRDRGWDSFNALLQRSIRALETSGLARHVETRLTREAECRLRSAAVSNRRRVAAPGSPSISIRASQPTSSRSSKRSTTSSWPQRHRRLDIMVYLECEDWASCARPRHSDPHHPRGRPHRHRPILMRRPRRARGS